MTFRYSLSCHTSTGPPRLSRWQKMWSPRLSVAEYVVSSDCLGQPYLNVGRSPCPCCNTTQFEHFPNKGLRRSLYEFKVYCTNKSQGCQWTGELRQLASHLNINAFQSVDGCQYVQVPCSYCSKPFQQLDITVHQNDGCGMRP